MLSKDEYQKLLTENIRKTYKMTNRRKIYDINNETKSIAKQLSVDEHIEYTTMNHILPSKTTKRTSQTKYHVG